MEFNHAIITGGSSGIGLAVAKQLAGKNYNLSLIARNKTRLADAQNQLNKLKIDASQKIEIFPADVTNNIEIEETVESAISNSGVPNILITCAGAVHPGYFNDFDIEVFEQLMAVNYLGTVYTVKAVLPHMRNNKSGHIVLVSSAAGLIGIYGYSAYSPTKFALTGFAQSLRSEIRRDNINVSIVYPPDTDTPQFHEENKLKPPECRIITNFGGLLSAEKVADCILKGINRTKFIITPGIKMLLLARLNNILSPLLLRYFDYLIDKHQGSKK